MSAEVWAFGVLALAAFGWMVVSLVVWFARAGRRERQIAAAEAALAPAKPVRERGADA